MIQEGTVLTDLKLQPHPGDEDMGPLQVSASARCDGDVLQVRWLLVDPARQVMRAEISAKPEQRNHLWHGTCFEAFLAAKGQPGYWEVNVSPAGHWNLFRFAAYRVPSGTACPVSSIAVRRRDRLDGMELEADLPLDRLALRYTDLELGLCAMLFAGDGRRGHWALHHPGELPDFHLRKGLVLQVANGVQCPVRTGAAPVPPASSTHLGTGSATGGTSLCPAPRKPKPRSEDS